MKVREFDLSREDIEAARAWLEKRALDIDGDLSLVGWKEHLVSSVVSHALPEGKQKRKTKATAGQAGQGKARRGEAG